MKAYILAICCALVQLAHADDLPVDETLASNAVAVVRVSLIFSDVNSKTKFTHNLVHTIRVFKNDSNRDFRDIDVLSFKGRPGVPEKECTIYIQAWDVRKHVFSRDRDAGSWILVGGDATNGVSHVEQSVTGWKPFLR